MNDAQDPQQEPVVDGEEVEPKKPEPVESEGHEEETPTEEPAAE